MIIQSWVGRSEKPHLVLLFKQLQINLLVRFFKWALGCVFEIVFEIVFGFSMEHSQGFLVNFPRFSSGVSDNFSGPDLQEGPHCVEGPMPWRS